MELGSSCPPYSFIVRYEFWNRRGSRADGIGFLSFFFDLFNKEVRVLVVSSHSNTQTTWLGISLVRYVFLGTLLLHVT